MSVKEGTLQVLENNKGRYISGGQISQELQVSRNAVWKAIKVLQSEGYDISATHSKGYCLSLSSDILSSQSINKYISSYPNVFEITVKKTVSSTNNIAKDLAHQGAKEGTVLISEEQTAGKGRLGKSFYSPSQTGLYMSIILRPQLTASQSLLITAAASVAVARVVENISGVRAKIKWVNDIYCNNKKVSGILTEASFNVENNGIEFIVLGIGVNIKKAYTWISD